LHRLQQSKGTGGDEFLERYGVPHARCDFTRRMVNEAEVPPEQLTASVEVTVLAPALPECVDRGLRGLHEDCPATRWTDSRCKISSTVRSAEGDLAMHLRHTARRDGASGAQHTLGEDVGE